MNMTYSTYAGIAIVCISVAMLAYRLTRYLCKSKFDRNMDRLIAEKKKAVPTVKLPDITEPVRTLIKLIENDPGRFDVVAESGNTAEHWNVTVKDREVGISVRFGYYFCFGRVPKDHTYLTSDEVKALIEVTQLILILRNEAWDRARYVARRKFLAYQLGLGEWM